MVNISTVKKKKIVNSIAEIEGSVYFSVEIKDDGHVEEETV